MRKNDEFGTTTSAIVHESESSAKTARIGAASKLIEVVLDYQSEMM